MKLEREHLAALTKVAISAARKAGNVVAKYATHDIDVEHKDGGSSKASQVVTKVDHMSEEIILQELLPTCALYDLGLLTEEDVDDGSRLEKDYFWCIDPLDGTLPFIEKIDGYAVAIALVSKSGTPQIGIVYDPVSQNLYHASVDSGVFKNEQPWIPIDPSTQNMPLTFVTDRSFMQHPLIDHVMDELNNIVHEAGYTELRMINHGGSVMHAILALENTPSVYFKFPKKSVGGGSLWDYAATTCIYKEAKAIAGNIYGGLLDLNRQDSTFLNHEGILFSSSKTLQKKIIQLFEKCDM